MLSPRAQAHGDLDIRINQTTEQILKDPQNAELYGQRAKLYYQHEEYSNSLYDLNFWRKYGGKSQDIDIYYARNYKAIGQLDLAAKAIDRILLKDKNHVILQRLKGQIHYEKKQYRDAAIAFEKVITHATKRIPENYLEAAYAYYEYDYDKATNSIKRGVNDIGNLFTFRQLLRDKALENGFFKDAIEEQSAIVDMSNRKETALFERAVIFQKAGLNKEAKKDLNAALVAISKLPESRMNSKSMVELRSMIRKALFEL